MGAKSRFVIEVKKNRPCLSGISDTCAESFKTTKAVRVCAPCTAMLDHVWEQKVKIVEDKQLKEFWSKLK